MKRRGFTGKNGGAPSRMVESSLEGFHVIQENETVAGPVKFDEQGRKVRSEEIIAESSEGIDIVRHGQG